MNWIALTAETGDVIRDQNGVPVEWTILRVGENPICQEGRDGAIRLTAEGMQQILAYHTKKGEEIPIDSEHYLYELANQKNLDEGETLKLFPGGVAAMGFGSLALAGKLNVFDGSFKSGSGTAGHAFLNGTWTSIPSGSLTLKNGYLCLKYSAAGVSYEIVNNPKRITYGV